MSSDARSRPAAGPGLGAALAQQATGQIDYRLARRHVVAEFKRGRMSRIDVCDAHPELLRAARNIGRETTEECPICEQRDLVLVSFAFGPGLPPSGRCVATAKELHKLDRRANQSLCYVVEVCPECKWNHLVRTFAVGGRARR